MSTSTSLLFLVFGALCVLVARPLGAASWRTQGAPYQFGSERAFRITYAGVGVVVCAASLASLMGFAVLDAAGPLMAVCGTQLCIRSRTLGGEAAAAAGRGERSEGFQRGVFVVGVLIVLFSPIVAFRL